MKRSYLPLVLLIVLGCVVKFYWAKHDLSALSVTPCDDVSQSCGNEMFKVQFVEEPEVMKPLHLKLHMLSAEAIKNIHVDFAMQDMQMGLNRYRLIQVNQSADWQAEVILPICVQGRSDWKMLIEIDSGKETKRFNLAFAAKANSDN